MLQLLEWMQEPLFWLVAAVLLVALWLVLKKSPPFTVGRKSEWIITSDLKSEVKREHDQRLEAQREIDDRARIELRQIAPQNAILIDHPLGRSRLQIINFDITKANNDVIVSSDDNLLTASGGVAKAIISTGGPAVRSELKRIREKIRLKQGDIAITSAGNCQACYILHPAVIDLNTNAYPTPEIIRSITRRCLAFAESSGARTIAFPVMGGGTASKALTAADSLHQIVREVEDHLSHATSALDCVAIYVFDRHAMPDSIFQRFEAPIRSGDRLH